VSLEILARGRTPAAALLRTTKAGALSIGLLDFLADGPTYFTGKGNSSISPLTAMISNRE